MGRRMNRRFAEIPIKGMLDNLAWKLEERGIEVVFTEESYTSKASFYDLDKLPTYGSKEQKSFSGKRVKRGLYQTANGSLQHADCQAASNIMRKYDPSIKPDRSGEDAVVHPVRELQVSY